MNALNLILALALTAAPLSAQTAKLEPRSLNVLDQKPATTTPKFVPKSTGPLVEKSRKYDFTSKAARVITMSDGSKIESPLVQIPLLFQKDSTELADAQSRANLLTLAEKLKQLQEGGVKLCIEGHASIDGDDRHNQTLSEKRAEAIRSQLIGMGVSDAALPKAVGRGSLDAVTKNKNAAESQLALDRRVLVVRER